MKVISYNLFEGAKDTRSDLIDFIGNEMPNVVCLQETNGWDENEQATANEFANAVDMPFFVCGASNTRFKLATFSRTPFANSQIFTRGFWHGVIRTSIAHRSGSIDMFNLHLNPGLESIRLEEAAILVSAAKGLHNAIFMGDLN